MVLLVRGNQFLPLFDELLRLVANVSALLAQPVYCLTYVRYLGDRALPTL